MTNSKGKLPMVFVGGLPRSGSTLLMNLLAQNPSHFCTPTSGLCHTFENVLLNWTNNIQFKTEGYEVVRPKVSAFLRKGLLGYHGDAIAAGKTVFEKNRAWPRYISHLDEIFDTKVYVVLCVRDIRCVVSSFEKLYRDRKLEYRYPQLPELFATTASLEGRVRHLMADDGMVGAALATTLDAARIYGQEKPCRLIRVSYQQFTHRPKKMMENLHEVLDLPAFDYNVENVEQKTKEDDLTFYGMDLHTLKSPVIKPQPKDWEILTPEIVEQLNKGNMATVNSWDSE